MAGWCFVGEIERGPGPCPQSPHCCQLYTHKVPPWSQTSERPLQSNMKIFCPGETLAWPSPTLLGLVTCSLALGTRRELLTLKEDFPWGQPHVLQGTEPPGTSFGLEPAQILCAGCVLCSFGWCPLLGHTSPPVQSLVPVQFSRSVVSNPLQPHGAQHIRPPCPLPTPGVYSNSCPLSR